MTEETAKMVAALQELIENWKGQIIANDNGWSVRHGNNLFNEGASAAYRSVIEEIEALLPNSDPQGNGAKT